MGVSCSYALVLGPESPGDGVMWAESLGRESYGSPAHVAIEAMPVAVGQ